MNDIIVHGADSPEVLHYCEFGDTYLKFREDTPYEAWAFVLGRLQGAEKSLRWWIGDAIRFGERKYGEMYSQALEQTEYAYDTLAKSVQVADTFDFRRRRLSLSFSHHQAVKSLEPAEQDEVLELAEQGGWSVQDTREAAREVRMIPAAARGKAKNEEVHEEGVEGAQSMRMCPHCKGDGFIPVRMKGKR